MACTADGSPVLLAPGGVRAPASITRRVRSNARVHCDLGARRRLLARTSRIRGTAVATVRGMRTHPALLLVSAVVLVGCESKKLDQAVPPATVESVDEPPQEYVGRTATVAGEVERVLGAQAFEIEGDGIVWQDTLLVLAKERVQFGPVKLRHGDVVVVRGTVTRTDSGVIEHELGDNLSPDIAQRSRGQLVLLAHWVRVVETGLWWSEDEHEGAVVSVVQLVSEPSPRLFAGTRIDVHDVVVQAKSGRGIWVGPSARTALLVVPSDPAMLATITVGERVDLEGTIRETPTLAEVVRQFALDAVLAERAVEEEVYVDAAQLTEAPIPAS